MRTTWQGKRPGGKRQGRNGEEARQRRQRSKEWREGKGVDGEEGVEGAEAEGAADGEVELAAKEGEDRKCAMERTGKYTKSTEEA